MDETARILIRACIHNHYSPIRILQFVQNSMQEACPHKTTIYRWIKKFKSGESDTRDGHRSGRPLIPKIERKINLILKRNKFSSTRSMARGCKVGRMTICRRMKKQLKMKYLKLRKIPHSQQNHIMSRRVEMCKEILGQLNELNPIDVITSDESWFCFFNGGDGMWVRNKDELDSIENQKNFTKKVMISIFWNFSNLYLIQILPRGESYNSEYVISTLFTELEHVALMHRPARGLKSYALHWDNARPHKSHVTTEAVESLFGCSIKHPPYSPDLAPSDFFLFGHLKRLLQGKVLNDEQQLKIAVENAFRSISKELKMKVYNEWIRRLEETIRREGEYIDN
jgi:histone-lysine N-methyltransferase SETMAR